MGPAVLGSETRDMAVKAWEGSDALQSQKETLQRERMLGSFIYS